MITGSVSQKNIGILNIYATNNRDLKYMKQKLLESQGDISTMIVADF